MPRFIEASRIFNLVICQFKLCTCLGHIHLIWFQFRVMGERWKMLREFRLWQWWGAMPWGNVHNITILIHISLNLNNGVPTSLEGRRRTSGEGMNFTIICCLMITFYEARVFGLYNIRNVDCMPMPLYLCLLFAKFDSNSYF